MPRKPRSQWTAEDFAKDQAYQASYYAKNQARLQKAKKERRDGDPEVREANRLRSKRYYWNALRPAKNAGRKASYPVKATLENFEPVGTALIPQRKRAVTFYPMAVVSELYGRDAGTLLVWERKGILPKPAWSQKTLGVKWLKGNNPRLYTSDEVKLLEAHREYLDLPAKSLEESIFANKLHAAWAELDGGMK